MKLLSEEEVQEIRDRLQEGETHRSIAECFGVSRQTIGDIWVGRRHKKLSVRDTIYPINKKKGGKHEL